MYYAGATVLLGLAIYGYVSLSGDTRPIIMKDHISGFTSTVQPYVQNPMLIFEWLKANYWVSGFITGGVLIGGGIVNLIRRKTTQKAVDVAKETVKSGFKEEKQQLTAKKQQAETDFNVVLDKLEKKEKIINKQDEVITALEKEKKAVHDLVDERNNRIVGLQEERDIQTRKIKQLETELAMERGEIPKPVP